MPEGVIAGDPAQLSLPGSQPAGTKYYWEFGDGMTESGAVIEHVYAELQDEGFNVVLTVTDRAGNEAVFGTLVEPATMVRPDLFVTSLNFTLSLIHL